MPPLTHIPTHILTGFLGVGKTSAILHLLQQKPEGERWAILVNEFGEIGVDGSLFQGLHQETSGVYISEVPGGCMCCAAGVPMQIALSRLLKQARPDRLFIEPTGLGHPREVLQTLSSGHNKEVLSVQKVITLVDARHLSDRRYTEHETFNQQIDIADLIVANKQDLYSSADIAALKNYIHIKGNTNIPIILTQQGRIDLAELIGPAHAKANTCGHHHHHVENSSIATQPLPASGYLQAINQGSGYQSIGWRISNKHIFRHSKLVAFLNSLQAQRVKGVIITDEGPYAYNATQGTLTETRLVQCHESRIEIINDRIDERWEQQLLECRVKVATDTHQRE